MLPFELWIGWRQTWVRRRAGRDRFVSFVSASSMLGIALGVAALIVVISVMNGLQKEVRDRMLSVLPHIEVSAPGLAGDAFLDAWPRLAAQVQQHPEVRGTAPFVASQAMLAQGSVLRGALVRGIDPTVEGAVSELPLQIRDGSLEGLQPGAFGIVLGRSLARQLGLLPGDSLMVVSPEGTVTPAGVSPRMRQFTVVALFESGHHEFDSSLAFTHLSDAQRLFRDQGLMGLRVAIADMQRAPQVARELVPLIDPAWRVGDWTQSNRTWFAAVQTEKRMMFLILSLIVAVAAFNLLSSLVMTVNDKQADVAILRTIGVRPLSIGLVFLVQGCLIGVIGTLLGLGGGTALAYNLDVVVPWIESVMGFQFLPPEIYFISALPSDPRVSDIVTITVTALVLSLLATLYPSWRAARLQPAEVLRHEG